MTVLERKKFRLIKAIINDTDEERLSEMEKVYKSLKKKLPEPCMYTIEEIRESLPEIEKEFAEGKGISHEEVMKEYGL